MACAWIEDIYPPHARLHDPYAPTLLYVFEDGRRAYAGITIDLAVRCSKHRKDSHPFVQELVRNGDMRLFSRPDENGVPQPYYIERRVAERLELLLIRRLARDGHELLNKRHNPQYDWGKGMWTWQLAQPGSKGAWRLPKAA